MSCNKPLLAKPDGFTSTGKVKYMPIGRYDADIASEYPDAIKIPCGKCAGCRAQKTREWADRMILELDHSKKGIFLTLTYDNDHVPIRYQCTTGESVLTLNKRDVQLFMKRLKKRFPDCEIRRVVKGEYGKNTHRPHYHLALYGIGLEDFKDLDIKGKNELGDIYYKSDYLANDIWWNGFCLLTDISWNTCAYIAKYMKKKDLGLVTDEYVMRFEEPEFFDMSRNPGIGLYYPIDHPDYAEKSKYYIGDQKGAVEIYFPKAFLNYLEKNDPDKFEELKLQRAAAAKDSEISKIAQTDLTSMELDDISENHISSTEKVIDFYRSTV